MVAGLSLTLYYVVRTHPFFGGSIDAAWFGINPISSGVFGTLVGIVVIVVVSLLTKPPPEEIQRFVDYVRYPRLPSDHTPTLPGRD